MRGMVCKDFPPATAYNPQRGKETMMHNGAILSGARILVRALVDLVVPTDRLPERQDLALV